MAGVALSSRLQVVASGPWPGMEVGVRLSGPWGRLLALLTLTCLVSATGVLAQSGTSGLFGKVTDQQAAVLPGVTVTITNAAAAVTRSTVTDASGDYQFLALPPGTYSVKVELTGFRTAVRDNIPLAVDVRTRMDVPMEIGAQTETVEVTSVVSPINTTDASLGNVISQKQIRELPLEARNPVGLLSLQPGAVYLPHMTTTDPRSGSVSGSHADQSNVTLDGVDVNDPQYGTAYTSAVRVTTDSLQEFRVTTSNYSADTGRSSAAQVSMVTKSGTNQFHGSFYDFERHSRIGYANSEVNILNGNPKAAGDQRDIGWSIGGPIGKSGGNNKLFFFWNQEYNPRTPPQAVPITACRRPWNAKGTSRNRPTISAIRFHISKIPPSPAPAVRRVRWLALRMVECWDGFPQIACGRQVRTF